MNKTPKLSDLVDEMSSIFQPFATEDTWGRVEKFLKDYATYIKRGIISDIRNGGQK